MGKKLSFSGGAGGGNKGMMQQLSLPMSNKYDGSGTASAWEQAQIIAPNNVPGVLYQKCFDEEAQLLWAMYSKSPPGIAYLAINPNTLEAKEYFSNQAYIPNNEETTLFTHKGELYVWGFSGTNTQLYKVNKSKQSVAMVSNITITVGGVNSTPKMYQKVIHFTDTIVGMFLVCTRSGNPGYVLITYDFKDSLPIQISAYYLNSDIIVNTNTQFPYQQISPNEWLFLVPETANYFLAVYRIKYDSETNAFSISVYTSPTKAAFTAGIWNSGLGYATFPEKIMYTAGGLTVGAKQTGFLDLRDKTLTPNYENIPNFPDNISYSGTNSKFTVQANNRVICTLGAGSLVYLDTVSTPPENNARIAKIFKGQEVNTWYRDIDFLPLESKGQPAFSLTRQTWVADRDYEIHLGQYNLKGNEEPLTVVNS